MQGACFFSPAVAFFAPRGACIHMGAPSVLDAPHSGRFALVAALPLGDAGGRCGFHSYRCAAYQMGLRAVALALACGVLTKNVACRVLRKVANGNEWVIKLPLNERVIEGETNPVGEQKVQQNAAAYTCP